MGKKKSKETTYAFKYIRADREEYVSGLVKEFEMYLDQELTVLDGGLGYEIVYDYIEELENRTKRYIAFHNPAPSSKAEKKGMPRKMIKESICFGRAYLKGVADILRKKSDSYSPVDGSVPESIGELLEKLSGEVLRMKKG